METYRACPKCGVEGIEPTWHKACKNTSKAVKQNASTSDREHLHYFCKCGYDFIRFLEKKDATI